MSADRRGADGLGAVREGIEAWNGDSCCSAEVLFERDED
jgi:hypothetical protein